MSQPTNAKDCSFDSLERRSDIARRCQVRTEAASIGHLITIKEVAHNASVSIRTAQAWTYSKKIPSVKIGRVRRFRWVDVERALERFTIKEVR